MKKRLAFGLGSLLTCTLALAFEAKQVLEAFEWRAADKEAFI